jgi:putative endonuclease
MFCSYVLENTSSEMYFGSTNNLKRRLQEHQSGKSIATKGSDWSLIYYEAYKSEADAREREQKVKRNTGTKKHLKNRIARSRQFD